MNFRRYTFQIWIVIFFFLLVAFSRANDPPLREYYDRLIISNVQFNDDTIPETLKKLTVAMERDGRGTWVGIVLVTPDETLLRKRISKRYVDQSLKTIFDEVCANAGLRYVLDYNVVLMAAKGVDLTRKGLRVGTPRKKEFLESGLQIVIPDVWFDGADVQSATDVIREGITKYNATGKPVVIESKISHPSKGGKVYAWLPVAIPGDAVGYICLSAGYRYSSPSEGVYILLDRR